MTHATVADHMAWEALPAELQEQYRRVILGELDGKCELLEEALEEIRSTFASAERAHNLIEEALSGGEL